MADGKAGSQSAVDGEKHVFITKITLGEGGFVARHSDAEKGLLPTETRLSIRMLSCGHAVVRRKIHRHARG